MTHADDYPIVIRRGEKGYVAEAAALGLTRTGSDVTALEADMRAAVSEILDVCDRHGAQIDPSWDRNVVTSQRGRPYHRTIAGAMIIVVLVAVVSMPLLWGFQGLSAFMSLSSEQFSSARVEKALTSGVQKTADALEMITPERRNQLTHDFGRIAHALEPYAAQLRPLLVPAPAPPPQPANDRQ